MLKQLRVDYVCQVRLVWVPSHGKHTDTYVPPPGFRDEGLRALNYQADLEATLHLNRALEESGRGAWDALKQAAVDWSLSAIWLANDIGNIFFNTAED